MKYVLIFSTFLIATPAFAQNDLDRYKPDTSPKSDFQRALENPIQPNPPPTALQQLERGNIPSSANPRPPSGGFSPTYIPPPPPVRGSSPSGAYGFQYQGTFR